MEAQVGTGQGRGSPPDSNSRGKVREAMAGESILLLEYVMPAMGIGAHEGLCSTSEMARLACASRKLAGLDWEEHVAEAIWYRGYAAAAPLMRWDPEAYAKERDAQLSGDKPEDMGGETESTEHEEWSDDDERCEWCPKGRARSRGEE